MSPKKSFTITNLPKKERPRERLAAFGPESLSSQELLAILLGRGIAGESVLVTAQQLLSRFGSLEEIVDASIEDLQKVRGLGQAKASQIKACCEIARRVSPHNHQLRNNTTLSHQGKHENILNSVRLKIVQFTKEHFIVLSFDVRDKLIGTDIVSVGTLNMSLIHPRETFNTAIKRHAGYIILAHNHPSGDPQPSEEDIRITQRLVSAGKIIGIPVRDHIVITQDDYYSLREHEVLVFE